MRRSRPPLLRAPWALRDDAAAFLRPPVLVELRDTATGRRLLLASVHLCHSDRARGRAEAAALLPALRTALGAAALARTLLLGDFNLAPPGRDAAGRVLQPDPEGAFAALVEAG